MKKIAELLKKLGTVERHGAFYIVGFITLALFQFSLFESLIGAALIFLALLPHPTKDIFLRESNFGDFIKANQNKEK